MESRMDTQRSDASEFEGFVYRVLGPDGKSYRWIARTVRGQVAHGKTEEAAVQNLRDGLRALTEVKGKPYSEWKGTLPPDGSRFLRASELVQA